MPAATMVALPVPVARWLETAWARPGDHLDTLALVGRGRMRREGEGPQLPVRFRMSHELGRQHVAEFDVGIGPVTLMRGLEGFVDGHGISQSGHVLEHGPEIDQGAFLFLWAEAWLFPAAWPQLSGLRWRSINHHAAVLELPFGGAREEALVHFDHFSGFPVSFEASRHKGEGPRAPWRMDYADWGFRNGLPVPGSGSVRWADEPAPWLTFRIDDLVLDPPVAGAFGRARDALARAMGTLGG